jgi:hypothetical protein
MVSHDPSSKLVYDMSGSSSNSAPGQLGEDDKYSVDVFMPPKAIPTPKDSLEAIKGAVKGKMLAKMKKEAVDCPVKLKKVSFVECFTCPNFNRRVRGRVGCKGLPLTQGPVKV